MSHPYRILEALITTSLLMNNLPKAIKIVMVNSQIYIPPKDLFLLIRFTAKLHPVNLTIIKIDRGSRK